MSLAFPSTTGAMANPSTTTCSQVNDTLSLDSPRPWAGKAYIAVTGAEAWSPYFAACCQPYTAEYLAPCTMWCQMSGGEDALHKMQECWKNGDYNPKLSQGASGIVTPPPGVQDNSYTNGAVMGAATAVGIVVVFGSLAGLCFWRKKRAARKDPVLPVTVSQAGEGGKKERYSTDSGSQASVSGRV